MSDEHIMIWEVVVVVFEVQETYAVDDGPNLIIPVHKTLRNTKRKRYFSKPNGDDIGKFLSNSLPTESIISVEVHQYQANLTPIETEES